MNYNDYSHVFATVFFCCITITPGLEINNGVLGIPTVTCMQESIQMTFTTEDVFSGRIYVKGRVDDPDCSKKISRDQGASEVTFVVPLGECGMHRSRSLVPVGINMMVTVVVSFHLVFVTKVDRAYRLQCLFKPNPGKMLTQSLDVSMLPTTPLGAMGGVQARCEYSIRRGDVDGPQLRFAAVGDKAFHVWECDAGSGEYGILVYGCEASDTGSKQTVAIVDDRGCSVDPVLIEPIQYDSRSLRAWAVTHVFKYSDQTAISFQCDIKICSNQANDCDNITPPNCSKDDLFLRRTGKVRKTRNVDSDGITVTAASASDLQFGVISDEILVFDPHLLDYGLASKLEEKLGLNSEPRTTMSKSPDQRLSNRNQGYTTPASLVELTEDFTQGADQKKVSPHVELPYTVAVENNHHSPNGVCVSNDVFALMMTSSLLSLVVATLFMALVLARLLAHLCIAGGNARPSPDAVSVWSSWSPNQTQPLMVGEKESVPHSTCSSAWSRHALPPSWQQSWREQKPPQPYLYKFNAKYPLQ